MESEQYTAEKPMSDQRKKGRNQKIIRYSENENTTYQNLWEMAKVLKEKFVPKSAYTKI
jgi:hypothetical protein